MLERLKARAIAWWLSVREERGATAVEYALMVALIAIVALTAVQTLGTNVSQAFSEIASAIGGV